MVNVLLLLSSLVLLFMGIILRINYFMDKLGFITVYFEASSVSTYIHTSPRSKKRVPEACF
jgi:hypothetical protein